jgi:hypothetical protein
VPALPVQETGAPGVFGGFDGAGGSGVTGGFDDPGRGIAHANDSI